MTTGLTITQRDAVLDILLDSPQTGNLITPAMGDALSDALRGVGPEVKLVRLTGAGADFCRGRQSPPIDRATATAMAFRRTIADGPLYLYDAFRTCRAPILALVRGQALGVGCALAALSDLTVVAQSAVFGVPELNHGIPPTLVISALADRLPMKAILHLVLTRRPLGAEEAQRAGIAGQIVPDDELNAAGDAIESSLAGASAMALQAVKEYALAAGTLDSRARDALAGTMIATVQSSQHR